MMTTMMTTIPSVLAVLPIVLPLAACLALAALRLVDVPTSEQSVERLVRAVMLVSCAAALTLAWLVQRGGAVRLDYGAWLESGLYRFDLELLVDRLSLVYLLTSCFIASAVGYFSARYLHRDPGFVRFFIWFLVFVGGMHLLILAGGFNLLVAGWELVGLGSVFLVGFYGQRSGPAANSLQVFTAYRVADIGLLGAAALMHWWLGGEQLPAWGAARHAAGDALAMLGGCLILWAAMGKSAQGPFAFWLPRAMEGPTPSSAIFYGSLSVHAGAYLLLRMAPAWEGMPALRVAVVVVGLGTAAYGAFVGRTRTDVKTLLACASLAQVGLIFAEIGSGLHELALWHMVGHSMVRTLQFLRAPSAISDWRGHGAGAAASWGARHLLPRSVAVWLYRQSLGELNLESLIREYLTAPVLRLARFLDFSERELAAALERPSRRAPPADEAAAEGIYAPREKAGGI